MATRQATESAAEAPIVEEGMFDMVLVSVADKKVKGGLYTKDPVNGDPKLEWAFAALDDEGQYMPYITKEGPVENKVLEVSKLTGVGFNIKAKTVPQEIRVLKAILTKAEFAAFEGGEGTPDDAVAAPEGLLGRKVQGEVFVKENGWPGIGNIVAPRGGQKGANFAPEAAE